MVHKTQHRKHRKLKIKQHKIDQKLVVSSGAPEMYADKSLHVAPIVLLELMGT